MGDNRAPILLVDDDENDTFLMRAAFEGVQFSPFLTVLEDGEQAIQYLNGDGMYENRSLYPWPRLMLLDLKMPKVNGFEVLAWVKKQKQLPDVPIIVMSSSNLESDIHKATELGAFSYFVKSSDSSYYLQVAKAIRSRCFLNPNNYQPFSHSTWSERPVARA